MFLVKLPLNRHPERSASQIDCVPQRLWRGVEGPRRCLFYPCCSELFNHRARTGRAPHDPSLELIRTINPELKDLAQTWGWKMITVHEKMYP
jgi:hypothetical protein